LGTCLVNNGAHAVVKAGTTCEAQSLRLQGDGVQSLRRLGMQATGPVSPEAQGRSIRLGTDIMRRGDFSSVGLFGTTDRGWIVDDAVSVDRSMRIHIAPGEGKSTGGMKVFQRVFRPSNPTSFSGRLRVSGDAELRVLLQRRLTDASLGDALASGPAIEVGRVRANNVGWTTFSFDFNQPRVATRSVRLLFEVLDRSAKQQGATVELDDLIWVEWSTPWLNSAVAEGSHATHIQVE
jgi:hypothetical protein